MVKQSGGSPRGSAGIRAGGWESIKGVRRDIGDIRIGDIDNQPLNMTITCGKDRQIIEKVFDLVGRSITKGHKTTLTQGMPFRDKMGCFGSYANGFSYNSIDLAGLVSGDVKGKSFT